MTDRAAPATDPVETRAWLDPPEGVTEVEGRDRDAAGGIQARSTLPSAACCSW